nr:hypothetical protein [Thermoleophilaceae bacterium]
TQYGGPAIDSNGKANCGSGQTGYPVGRLAEGSRYGPNELGGRNIVIDPTTPGRRGGTYKSRQLGIDGLGNLR